MVAVTHREADSFVASKNPSIDVFLVFGSDSGLISERAQIILKSAGLSLGNPDQIIRIDGDEIANNPGLLFEEAHGIGLFADKRAILIRAGGKQIISPLETMLEAPAPDCKIIIMAGPLRKDAPLRALATRAKNAAAIECYPDQTGDLERLIDSELNRVGLNIDPPARLILASLLGDDRLSTRAELEKLILYTHGTGIVTESDVINAVADASVLALDNIVFSTFSGVVTFLGDEGAHIYSRTSETFALISAATRHCQLLNQIRIDVESGTALENAVERNAGRIVFGARRKTLSDQASFWKSDSLTQCYSDLVRSTLETRREPNLSNAIVMNTLLGIARRYQTLRRAT